MSRNNEFQMLNDLPLNSASQSRLPMHNVWNKHFILTVKGASIPIGSNIFAGSFKTDRFVGVGCWRTPPIPLDQNEIHHSEHSKADLGPL